MLTCRKYRSAASAVSLTSPAVKSSWAYAGFKGDCASSWNRMRAFAESVRPSVASRTASRMSESCSVEASCCAVNGAAPAVTPRPRATISQRVTWPPSETRNVIAKWSAWRGDHSALWT